MCAVHTRVRRLRTDTAKILRQQVVRIGVKANDRWDSDDQVYGIINGSVDVNARRGQEAGVPFVPY